MSASQAPPSKDLTQMSDDEFEKQLNELQTAVRQSQSQSSSRRQGPRLVRTLGDHD